MRKEEQPIVERLRADDEFNNRGPGYEPLRVPASALRLEAASTIEALQAEIERLKGAMERAYGILWRDTGLRSVEMSIAARKELLVVITKDGQKRGIEHAASTYGHVSDSEMLASAQADYEREQQDFRVQNDKEWADKLAHQKDRATTAESEASALRKRVEELESALRPFGRRSTRDRSAVEMVGACGLRLTHFDRARTLTEGGNNAG